MSCWDLAFLRPLLFWSVFQAAAALLEGQGEQVKAYSEYLRSIFPFNRVSKYQKAIGTRFWPLTCGDNQDSETASFLIDPLKDEKNVRPLWDPTEMVRLSFYVALLRGIPEKSRGCLRSLTVQAWRLELYLLAITDILT